MNKERRKQLADARDLIDKAEGLLSEAKEMLEWAKADEQEYYDNMPESLQGGDKGQAAEAAVSALDDAVNELDSAIEACQNAAGNIETAQE